MHFSGSHEGKMSLRKDASPLRREGISEAFHFGKRVNFGVLVLCFHRIIYLAHGDKMAGTQLENVLTQITDVKQLWGKKNPLLILERQLA